MITRYSVIPIMSLEGIHNVYMSEGTVNGNKFMDFVTKRLLPLLMPFTYVNPRSVVITGQHKYPLCGRSHRLI